jgi:hypothetical protein
MLLNTSRTFNGIKYALFKQGATKLDANRYAKAIRADGYSARVVKYSDGGTTRYAVYARQMR